MITSLAVSNFKCFQRASFDLRPLTVLTGVNGGGKSSLIQAMLLARSVATSADHVVSLNGPHGLALGSARDILHWAAVEPNVGVQFGDREANRSWGFFFAVPDGEDALHLLVDRRPTPDIPGINNTPGGFTYLCAERLGPRDSLALSAEEPNDIGVGVHGEFSAQVLALRETRVVDKRTAVREALHHPETSSPLLRLQTQAWASDIIRPIRINAQLAVGVMASTIRFEESAGGSDAIRPTNTGFGVSYALPIIIAGLLTQPDDILIVENPEAHLHPAGQSKLGAFLARVAGSGVQVIVETHSDHVLNGARLAVARDRSLRHSDMIVHYFGPDQRSVIEVNAVGELDHWPDGFFDQIESDLGGLARARRSR